VSRVVLCQRIGVVLCAAALAGCGTSVGDMNFFPNRGSIFKSQDWGSPGKTAPDLIPNGPVSPEEQVDAAGHCTAQAGATPAEKQALVGRLRAGGRKVLMVGDGLNDGPALAAADASMAPGSASDVGLQAADLVFVQDSLLALPRALRGARRTMAVVRQNFALAIGYNVLAVPLAMAGLVTPLIAAVAMSTSSLIVIANSLRLARAAR
jgi:magnesium-transporting ATPase (P-type)